MKLAGNLAAVARVGDRLPSIPRPSRLPRLPDWRTLKRRLIVTGLILCILAAAYWFWFRGSSFVAVEDVKIEGAEQAPQIESALRGAAEGQSTLDFDMAALEQAVAGDPLVGDIAVEADFPSGVLIDVELRTPAGYLGAEGAVVAGDGTVLERVGERPEGVPSIELEDKEAGAVAGDAATGDALAASKVLGAAPQALAVQINEAAVGGEFGVTVDIGPGLELRFGSPSEAALKWRAAAAVLASPKFDGAAYLDLSVPKRPVAGGVPEPSETAITEEVAPVEEVAVPPVEEVPVAPVEEVPVAPVEPVVAPST
jgi:cell division septal protein FtsQ